jgi:hypothetical protein
MLKCKKQGQNYADVCRVKGTIKKKFLRSARSTALSTLKLWNAYGCAFVEKGDLNLQPHMCILHHDDAPSHTELSVKVSFIYLWLYSPLLGLGRFFSFLILYTVGRTPWTDLPTQNNTNTE